MVKRMKGVIPIMFFVLAAVALLVVAVAGGELIGIANLLASVSGGTTAKVVLEPQYGSYECALKQYVNDVNLPLDSSKGYWEGIIGCPANGKDCEIGVRTCCDGVGCNSASAVYIEMTRINVYGMWGVRNEFSVPTGTGCKDITYPVKLVAGESMHVSQVLTAVLGTARYTDYGIRRYNEYHLIQRPHNGGVYEINPVSCTFPAVKYRQIGDQIIPEICVSGCISNKPTGKNTLDFGEYWNYLGGYSLAPTEYLVTDADGQQAYCQNFGTYSATRSLKTVVTDSFTYYIPDAVKRNVDCCPWQTRVGYSCENFAWEEIGTGGYNCDVFGTISSCPGSGSWVMDPSDPARQTIFKATGCDAGKKCIMVTQKVECTTDTQCQSGWRCVNYGCIQPDVDPWRPTCGNNVCEAGENDKGSATYCPADCGLIPTCGNRVCEAGEDAANCPSDCFDPFSSIVKFLTMWIVGTIIAAVLLLILNFFVRIPILKAWKYFLIAAVVLGLAIAMVFAMPVAGLAAQMFGGVML